MAWPGTPSAPARMIRADVVNRRSLRRSLVRIVMAFDQHREQIAFDALDTATGEVSRGRTRPADRLGFRRWLRRWDGAEIEAALEATTGWRFMVEELRAVGAEVHLAEPAETSARRGPKKRAKTDRQDARRLRELLQAGRVPGGPGRPPPLPPPAPRRPLRGPRHHRLRVRSQAGAGTPLAPGPADAALGAVRGRPGRTPGGLSRPRLLRRVQTAPRPESRLPVDRPQAAQARPPHAARARRGGAPAGLAIRCAPEPDINRSCAAGSRHSPAATAMPWTALKDRAAAQAPPAGTPHQPSRRRPREGRGPR